MEREMPAITGFGYDKMQKVWDDREAVVNHAGSAERPKCGCGSWLNHWLAYTGHLQKGSLTHKCVYMGCSSTAVDGAHIQEVNYKRDAEGKITVKPKGAVYIVPMCSTHNRSKFKEPFFIRKDRWMINDEARDLCKTVTYLLHPNNYFHMQIEAPTGTPKCGCPSHFAHYRNVTGSARTRCVAMECASPAMVAAPMTSLDGRRDMETWIAPLCRAHAVKGKKIFVKRQAEVANPAKHKNCGR
jgi:hypothetical protein